MERKRKRKESIEVTGLLATSDSCFRAKVQEGMLTEDELLGRRKHVEGECDFILVAFALEPAEKAGRVEHRRGEHKGHAGEEDESYKPGGVKHREQARHHAIGCLSAPQAGAMVCSRTG